MESVDFLIRNQLAVLAVLLFAILMTAGLLYVRYVKRISVSSATDWLTKTAGIALLPPALVGGGLSMASFDPIPRTVFLDIPQFTCNKHTNRKLLVFIHGWNGDPKETWRNFPTLACRDPGISDVDVLVVDYPTYMARRNVHLAELSDWLSKKLDILYQSRPYAKMAIVAHSMGGVIAREIIINRQLARRQASFGLVVSIASPHKGADIASLGDILNISKPLTEEIKPGSSFLATLQTHWEGLIPRPSSHCYSSHGDTVVSSDSALAYCDYRTMYPYRWNHKELVKPDDRNDDRYALPMNMVSQFLR